MIRILKPNVTKEEAVRAFHGRGLSALYRRIHSGPLQRIAAAYVPFWFFRVQYELIGAPQKRLFALDAVNGSLDLFEFLRIPGEGELLSLDCRNQLAPALSEDRAAKLLREKVMRVIFQQGFFKLHKPRIEITRESSVMYLPYWLGFYGESGAVRCLVMDAVRRRIEGAKASAFFEQWLTA